MSRRLLLILVVGILSLACVVDDAINNATGDLLARFGLRDVCAYTAPYENSVDTTGVAEIRIITGSGDLAIWGRPDSARLKISGTACASREDLLETVEVAITQKDNALLIETIQPDPPAPHRSLLDLVIELPDDIPLHIIDGDGPITVEQVQSVRLNDGSGPTSLSRIRAGIVVEEDGTGEMIMRDIQGGIIVYKDGAGDIVMHNIEGDITIEEDGSGPIQINQVNGKVTIGKDRNGDIEIKAVTGPVRIWQDGSGDIDIWSSGEFQMGEDGSGKVRVDGEIYR